jgi:hypothetical protein
LFSAIFEGPGFAGAFLLGYSFRMLQQPPLQLTPEEETDLIEAEAQIERGEIATTEEVCAMWAKHGLDCQKNK